MKVLVSMLCILNFLIDILLHKILFSFSPIHIVKQISCWSLRKILSKQCHKKFFSSQGKLPDPKVSYIPSAFRMRTLFMFFLYFHIVSGLNYEGKGLISLLSRTTVPKSIQFSWNSSDSTPCHWRGIRCDHRHRVVSLNISNYGILGELGQEIGQLKFLKKLDLSMNSFSGMIPSALGNCSQLKHLDLSTNSLTGEIPENLKNLIHLRLFAVKRNYLGGGVPKFLFDFPHLRFLSLGSNNFSGSIPSSVGNMNEIISLWLNHNQFSGTIPYIIGNCRKLEELHLNDNNLVGSLPTSLKNLERLVYLDVSSNRLHGGIPVELTQLRQLRNLSLYNNSFSGVIPQTLGIKSSLEHIDFTNNNFSSNIPPNLCFHNQLKVLHMGQNQLLGTIPSDVGSCSALKRLILKQNNLIGSIPQFIENHNLLFLDLSRNNFNGTIPSSLGNCANLTSINLSMNQLTGSIPQELGHLTELQKLDLSHNCLQGPLQPELSKCKKLFSLDVGFNSFNGSIPSSLKTLTQLNTLLLGENQFSGGIPDFLADLELLLELHLGGNSIGGQIPPSLGKMKNLEYTLNLSGNRLTGEIPSELSALSRLQNLDISYNNLTGTLTPLRGLGLALHSLLQLNISYNLFNGSVPDELLKFLKSPSSFLGNPDLHIPCKLGGSAFEGHSRFSFCGTQTSRRLSRVKMMIAIGLLLFCISCIIACYCSVRVWMEERQKHCSERFLTEFPPRSHLLSLKDVMEATNGLNENFIIGRGAHGIVYKAEFQNIGQCAVKKIAFSGHNRGNTSMRREIQTHNTIKHRNVMKLIDFCFEKDYGLILYKYMPNGSLHDVLHEISPAPSITWDVRYKIALGTAEGLAYLHDDCEPAVVHQDIKPQNILLDSDMEPHISDFGIAKLMDHSLASIHTITVIGTVGYIAPEIAFTMTKNKASDVYSYGVVLFELITRKRVMDPSFPDGMNIVRWVHTTWSRTGVINDVMDPDLVEFAVPEIMQEMKTCLLIALQCTEKEPRKRPIMRDVVKQLKDARAMYLWSSLYLWSSRDPRSSY